MTHRVVALFEGGQPDGPTHCQGPFLYIDVVTRVSDVAGRGALQVKI